MPPAVRVDSGGAIDNQCRAGMQRMTKAEMKQLEMLRVKTPEQRFAMMVDLIGAQFNAMRAGIKFQNPEAAEPQLARLFKERVRKIYSLKR